MFSFLQVVHSQYTVRFTTASALTICVLTFVHATAYVLTYYSVPQYGTGNKQVQLENSSILT